MEERLIPKPPAVRLRPLLLTVVSIIVIVQIVALMPSTLEQDTSITQVDPASLIPSSSKSPLATGIPSGIIPDYAVEKFNYSSTVAGRKQWRLEAIRAHLYQKERIVHSFMMTAYLYDPDDKITVVTGTEAKYFMDQRDLEVFGDVETRFPDGFVTHSPYLRYRPDARKVEIPPAHPVHGGGKESDRTELHFKSHGMDMDMKTSEVVLHRQVQVNYASERPSDTTEIHSDHCVIERPKRVAHFTMDAKRPLAQRYVKILQPTLFTQSRRSDLAYGEPPDVLTYLTAFEDVVFKELPDPSVPKTADSLRYGTAGRADFDRRRNVIVLTDFPQVYQDRDTVTGERIVLHRDTDIVEIEQSNAFSEGDLSQ